MSNDPRLTNELSRSNQMQHVANRAARTANQLAYLRLLVDLGLPVPAAVADEIEAAVGDASSTLSKAAQS